MNSAFSGVARWINHYRDKLDPDRQFGSCTPDDVEEIAHDLSMTAEDLRTVVRRGPDGARLLSKMLTAMGADPRKLAIDDPLTMRDLQRLCASCAYKRQCEHDLAEGRGVDSYHDYCPSAYTLDMLFHHTPEAELANHIDAAKS